MYLQHLRRAALVAGALSAVGIAEQHHDPAPILEAIPFGTTPLWVWLFSVVAVACLVAAIRWPKGTWSLWAAAVLLGSAVWMRAIALFIEYRWDLWGTVARDGVLLPLLIASSWGWTGSSLRTLHEVGRRE